MKKLASLFTMMCIFLTSCSYRSAQMPEKYAAQYFYMDTVMDFLSVYGKNAQAATDAAALELQRLDTLLSTQNEQSEIYALNRDGYAHLSKDAAALLETSLSLYETTGAAFDVSVYPLMTLWGFYDAYHYVPSQEEIDAQLLLTGSDKIVLSEDGELAFALPGMGVDLGAIAKGYAAKRVLEVFRSYEIPSAVVSLGGTIVALGEKPDGSPWRIGVQAPDGSSSVVGTLLVCDSVVATSGGYRRYFEQDGILYHHILDPRTGKPARSGLLSVTIVCEDAVLADALSTALFVMGPQEAQRYWRAQSGFEFVLLCEDSSVLVSEGLDGRFEYAGDYEVIRR